MSDIDSILAVLNEWFPKTIVREQYRPHVPLKVGIDRDLAERCPALSTPERFMILRIYTGRLMHLQSLVAGAFRIDLDGNACGEVIAEQAEYAAARIVGLMTAREAKRIAAQSAAKRPAKIAPTIVQPATAPLSPLKTNPILRLPAFRRAS